MANAAYDVGKANAIIEKLCPHHFPYISRCFACRSFLHKVSKELFSQEHEKTKALAESAHTQRELSEMKTEMADKDIEIAKLHQQIADMKAVHFLPGSETEWQVHALAGRLNRRLNVTTSLLKSEPDCAVDIDGFDATKLTTRIRTTIKNDKLVTTTKDNPVEQSFKIPKKVYKPCGTEKLFSERPTFGHGKPRNGGVTSGSRQFYQQGWQPFQKGPKTQKLKF